MPLLDDQVRFMNGMNESDESFAEAVRRLDPQVTREAALISGRFYLWLLATEGMPCMAPAEALDFFRKRESELREKWLTEIGKPYDENNYHQIEKLEQSLDDVRFACGELHWILGDEAQAENFWNQTLKKYKPFIYLHRSRRYEKRGDSKWAVTWCYTFSCDAGTLAVIPIVPPAERRRRSRRQSANGA